MPHGFDAVLLRLHADLGAKRQANAKEAHSLAEAMKAVETVIHVFDPDYDTRRIAVRRRNNKNPWFKKGTTLRAAMDVLRTATEPLTTRQIVERMLAAKGIADPDHKAFMKLCGAVQTTFRKHDGRGFKSVGEGYPAKWALA
jgi:hypothetical protein